MRKIKYIDYDAQHEVGDVLQWTNEKGKGETDFTIMNIRGISYPRSQTIYDVIYSDGKKKSHTAFATDHNTVQIGKEEIVFIPVSHDIKVEAIQ